MKLVKATTEPYPSPSGWPMPEDAPTARVSGTAWVDGNARVSGTAWVSGTARVSGNADIRSRDDYLVLSSVGTRQSDVTLHRDSVIGIRVNTGCFSGSVKEFMAKLTKCPAHKFYKTIIPLMANELKRRMTPLPKTSTK